jgi:hypothetical protein
MIRIAATSRRPSGGLIVGCLYLPNGNPAPGPKFDYKLRLFDRPAGCVGSPPNGSSYQRPPSVGHGRSSASPWYSARGFRSSARIAASRRSRILTDLVADLGRREGGSVYKPTPTIDFILGTDDHLIGIAIHGDEALGLLDLLHQISDGHDLVSIGGIPRFIA